MNEQEIHSVIILNYNDSLSTITLVKEIINYENIDNIVIMDNCSTDDSIKQFEKMFSTIPKVYIMRSDKNGGYAYGNDVGCRYAIEELNSTYLTIANPDVYFTEEVIERQLNVIRDIKNRAGVVGSIMHCHSDINLPSAWKLPKYSDCILENLMILRRLIGNKTKYVDYSRLGLQAKVDVIAGSLFTIGAETYLSVNGFDTNTFLYYEENILAYRLIQKGFNNYLLTDQYYEHMHSISINKSYRSIKDKLDIAYISRVIYLREYLNCSTFQLYLCAITYYIGRIDYLVAKKIHFLIKRRGKGL